MPCARLCLGAPKIFTLASVDYNKGIFLMKRYIQAALMASAFFAASTQANAADYIIDNSQPGGLGNTASPFYVKINEPSYIEAVINGIRPTTGTTPVAFTDTFTFFLPFTGLGSGAAVSTNFNNLDLTSLFIEIYDAGNTFVEQTIFGNRTTSGVSVSLDANTLVPADRRVVLTFSGIASGGTYSGNLSATATPAVPEPATWAMLLAGFGAVGFTMRRKRQQKVAVSFA